MAIHFHVSGHSAFFLLHLLLHSFILLLCFILELLCLITFLMCLIEFSYLNKNVNYTDTFFNF